MIYFVIVLELVIIGLLVKLLMMLNIVKTYQYTNHLKSLGFIKKTVESVKTTQLWNKVRIHK